MAYIDAYGQVARSTYTGSMHDSAGADAFYQLPTDLPAPVDDGAADHLAGMEIPSVPLLSTSGEMIDLATRGGTTVVYAYPRTGAPGSSVPSGWDEIPGARGCTPQSCAFRNHYTELRQLRAEVFGLSTQDPAYQREAVERLHLPFALLSDEHLELTKALGLPIFEFDGVALLKRLTMIVEDGWIMKVFYPVFPPDQNADAVIAWLRRA